MVDNHIKVPLNSTIIKYFIPIKLKKFKKLAILSFAMCNIWNFSHLVAEKNWLKCYVK